MDKKVTAKAFNVHVVIAIIYLIINEYFLYKMDITKNLLNEAASLFFSFTVLALVLDLFIIRLLYIVLCEKELFKRLITISILFILVLVLLKDLSNNQDFLIFVSCLYYLFFLQTLLIIDILFFGFEVKGDKIFDHHFYRNMSYFERVSFFVYAVIIVLGFFTLDFSKLKNYELDQFLQVMKSFIIDNSGQVTLIAFIMSLWTVLYSNITSRNSEEINRKYYEQLLGKLNEVEKEQK